MRAKDDVDDDMAAELLAELKKANQREGQTARRLSEIEDSVDNIFKRMGRPGSEGGVDGRELERKHAIELCLDRKSWSSQKYEGRREAYAPSTDEIEEAISCARAFKALLRNSGDYRALDADQQKSLSSFTFGGSQWALPTEFSNRVMSCLEDQTDFLSLLPIETISGSSITFPFDNSELTTDSVGWACESACEGPVGSLPPPGQIEIKPETLRCQVCATSDILEDAAFSVEMWLSRKVERAFRQKLSDAFVNGDGIGRPQGILNPSAGLQICEVGAATPAGEFRWQDLAALKWQLAPQYAARATFLMNHTTLGMCMSMSDGLGRPLWSDTPATEGRVGGRWQIAGSPVEVVSFMPDPEPGSTPVLCADLGSLYQAVRRRGLTFSSEPAGWCTVFRFSQRIGGAVVCPNAGRLLRVL
jgi:HK97 family phage major capsid protein